MRGKKAKLLRKIAKNLAKGMPERRLLAVGRNKKVHVTNPKHPEFGNTIDVQTRSAVNDPKSMRGIYRELKNQYMRS